jgi:hypothetical protein
MKHVSFLLSALAAALVSLAALPATPAAAQRVFVAAQGSDGNPCTFALPCRTFQHAHDVVPAGGEIDVLDPAGYGILTITKAISIQGHGFSGVSVPTRGIGITVNAGATDAVSLNGLLIDGSRTGSEGIRFLTGKSLAVENCVVRNVLDDGMRFASSAASPPSLSVSNSYFTENTNGIVILTSGSGAANASIDRSGFYSNANAGISVAGTFGTGALNVTVADSVASNNLNFGFRVESSTGQSISTMTLTHVVSSGNGVGINSVGSTSTILLAQSMVTANTEGFNASGGGAIRSYGDNYIDNNGSDVAVLSPAARQ